MNKLEFIELIKRNLGGGRVKIELSDDQINDAINRTRNMWIEWTVGNSSQEVYFTVLLRGGVTIYDLPSGVIDIIAYEDMRGSTSSSFDTGGINTLFSFDNHMYGQTGGPWSSGTNSNYNTSYSSYRGGNYYPEPYTAIDYTIAKVAIGDMQRLRANRYIYKYHKHTNQLEVQPTPDCKNVKTITTDLSGSLTTIGNIPCSGIDTVEQDVYSPGFVLVRSYMIEGSTLPTYSPALSCGSPHEYKKYACLDSSYEDYMWSEPWVEEYTTALCKITLGMIRRKFSGFDSLGNSGITMDGDQLISEGKEEKRDLEDKLETHYSHIGLGIIIG